MYKFLFVCILLAVLLYVVNWANEKWQAAQTKPTTATNQYIAEMNAYRNNYHVLAILLAKAMQNCAESSNIIAPKYDIPNPNQNIDIDKRISIENLLDQISKAPEVTTHKDGYFCYHFRGKKKNSCSLTAKELELKLQRELNKLTRRRNCENIQVSVIFSLDDGTDFYVVLASSTDVSNAWLRKKNAKSNV